MIMCLFYKRDGMTCHALRLSLEWIPLVGIKPGPSTIASTQPVSPAGMCHKSFFWKLPNARTVPSMQPQTSISATMTIERTAPTLEGTRCTHKALALEVVLPS